MGRGMVLGPLVVFGLSWGVFGISAWVVRMPPAWLTFEFCQYAEIGRNLAVEGTFDTLLVEPMALAEIDRDRVGRDPGRWPVVNRYPLPCLVVAAWMKLMGPTDLAAACSNGLAVALLAATAYAAARRWYGPGWAATVAVVFLANPSFYAEFLLLGTPDAWFAAIFLLELLAWSGFDPGDPRPRLAWSAGLGVLGGLAYLSRFNAPAFLAVQAGWLLRYRRWREAGLMTAAALAVASPMMAYNWHHFHRPFLSLYSAWNLLDRIGAYRVEPWLYYRVPDLARELLAHRDGVVAKFSYNLFHLVPRAIWSLWRLDVLIPLALVGPWFAPRGTAPRRFATWSVGLFALQLVLFSAMRLEFEGRAAAHTGRYFFWFAAPAVLIGVGTLRRVAAGRGWRVGLASAAILGQLVAFGVGWHAIASWHLSARRGVPGRDAFGQMLREVVPEGRVIASNQPHLTAWFQGLRSISLPANPDELARLDRESPTPVDYFYVDLDFNAITLDPYWAALVRADPRFPHPWEPRLLVDYEYAFPPAITRPVGYVMMRRKGIPPSRLEREMAR